ncbi:dihydroorotate dehydrogenase electron transfer subunit [Halobacillus dabanensis]|uniref:Dihydroorotate dehydrogenase B (NAD(+)), electron transfer subunit n=1 Tax=Halobacillus dabanensis TaxID=240302 RepID=A0A1I3VF37_HALDA|nr:dihydroorotate dehydrogenase electron transfer subunit [Halobacillus dabanensis]SFJ93988.1 dihydroorotate dehydrogenase electron transfer subunit [Halobacillus dabanensis]
MNRESMTILHHERIAKDTYQLVLKGKLVDQIEDPGQFVHLLIDGFYLRRPVSIADYDKSSGTVTLLYKVLGEGTKALTRKSVGEQLDVLGPGGQGFPLKSIQTQRALIIGGGIGIPPLYSLAKHLHNQGVTIISVLGFQSMDDAFLVDEFEKFGEVYITTDDGSLGRKGLVTDPLSELEGTFDTYFTCGPTPMLKAVSERLSDIPGYISMEERMGCGIGACFACVVESPDKKGYRRICCDGPVFRSEEVVLS